jgi:glycosyltransferase involved in cell wall biosynthesis
MRVLHVVTAFPRFEGDVITPWLVETLRLLKGRGIGVEVFTSSYRGLEGQQLFGIPVHRFRYAPQRWEDLTHDETAPDRMRKGLRYRLLALTYVVCGYLAIARLARREKYDVVHVHWPFPHALFGYAARKAGGCKVVSSFYGVELRWVKSRLPVFKPFLRWSVRSADAVTAISSYTAGEIRELARRDVSIIPFGSAIKEPGVTSGSQESAVPTILFAGRLVERKGVRYLIEALRLLKEKRKARLVVVGDGSGRAALEAQARRLGLRDDVEFTGFIPEEELERRYRECSIFVLPAVTDSKGDTEGLGTVLLDAMMHRKPVIASNVGGIPDIVKHEQSGLLVPEKDAPALAEAVSRLLDNSERRNRLGEQGYEYARQHFGWDRIIGEIAALYEGLA